jgi:hypothetical protein
MNRKRYAAVVFSAVFEVAAAIPSQGPRLTSVMRAKLTHAQKILEAVVTSRNNPHRPLVFPRCHSAVPGRLDAGVLAPPLPSLRAG